MLYIHGTTVQVFPGVGVGVAVSCELQRFGMSISSNIIVLFIVLFPVEQILMYFFCYCLLLILIAGNIVLMMIMREYQFFVFCQLDTDKCHHRYIIVNYALVFS